MFTEEIYIQINYTTLNVFKRIFVIKNAIRNFVIIKKKFLTRNLFPNTNDIQRFSTFSKKLINDIIFKQDFSFEEYVVLLFNTY